MGDPDADDLFDCSAEGTVSLLGLLPLGAVADVGPDQCEDEPVIVHLTACRTHALRCRRWLRERMAPTDPVDVYGTDFLMERWGLVEEQMQGVPILRMAHAA